MKRKQIKITITLIGKDDQGEQIVFLGDANQISATGFRVMCNIVYGLGNFMPTAQISIYGLALEKMTKLLQSRWNTLETIKNRVKIEAGNEGEKLITEFEGNITFVEPDFSSIPDVCLKIEAQAAAFVSKKPTQAYQFKGDIDIADIFQVICNDMGFLFENNGVSIKTRDVTLNGSHLDKLKNLAFAYSLDMYIENNLIAITPEGGSRNIKVPIITPSSGLIGYPRRDSRGVSFKCLYDPFIRFGGICKIKDSIIDVCNGEWRISGITKSLHANQTNGDWFCEIAATWRNDQNDDKQQS